MIIIQFLVICSLFYLCTNNNIYYIFLYVFFCFFLLGIYLSIFQIELFAAFLWLVECTVLFIFLLLLFYLNIKGVFSYYYISMYNYMYMLLLFFYLLVLNQYSAHETAFTIDLGLFGCIENYYEAFVNPVANDLFGFTISYYTINGVEFTIVGFLLLVGSVVCVNLYQMCKNIRVQSYNSFLSLFDFFQNLCSYSFFRKQSLIKQGNTKASLKLFKRI